MATPLKGHAQAIRWSSFASKALRQVLGVEGIQEEDLNLGFSSVTVSGVLGQIISLL